MTEISIKAADGSGAFFAYVARPKATPAGAVVVIQEIFGVSPAMRAITDAIADQGFIGVCPDLFWRLEPRVSLTDKTQAEWDKAFALLKAFDQDKGVEDLKATLAAARRLEGCNGRAGTIGFCLGGRLAALMAIRSDADCNVSYYGVMLEGLAGELRHAANPLLMHIAENDKFVSKEAQGTVLAAVLPNPRVEAHVYPGVDHAFARVDGQHWDGRAAAIANGRTAAFLARWLG
ncbi:dienelactone hydrolase family protein [Elioraea tepidiphila]|uniref:dienelactone hydrolase family protein n=1 Tax=Elioraea tepidiphila TaxID=457934 RepID=UPI0003766455|nr:dienelactone hydrolase family protein [Elioraea tepidiphila]